MYKFVVAISGLTFVLECWKFIWQVELDKRNKSKKPPTTGTRRRLNITVNPSAIELPSIPKDTQITQSTFIFEKYNQYICKHTYTMYPFPEARLWTCHSRTRRDSYEQVPLCSIARAGALALLHSFPCCCFILFIACMIHYFDMLLHFVMIVFIFLTHIKNFFIFSSCLNIQCPNIISICFISAALAFKALIISVRLIGITPYRPGLARKIRL